MVVVGLEDGALLGLVGPTVRIERAARPIIAVSGEIVGEVVVDHHRAVFGVIGEPAVELVQETAVANVIARSDRRPDKARYAPRPHKGHNIVTNGGEGALLGSNLRPL